MITVRATLLVFIRSSSVSGAASRSGTFAPSAKGKAGSCFHTWTCGSRMDVPAARAVEAAPASRVRRVRSDIYRFQFIHYILGAALVAGARPFPGDVEIHTEPAFEIDRLQHAMAAREIDCAIA